LESLWPHLVVAAVAGVGVVPVGVPVGGSVIVVSVAGPSVVNSISVRCVVSGVVVCPCVVNRLCCS
jgi:hypothetical protein